MAVLKTGGRADIASAYRALGLIPHNFMMAFGPGEDWWGTSQVVLLTFGAPDDDGQEVARIDPAHTPVTGLVLRPAGGGAPFVHGTDYTVDLATGRILRTFGGKIAARAIVQASYTATVPQPDLKRQTMVAESGRVSVSAIHHVVPFAEASEAANFVIVDGVKYAMVDKPSRILLFLAHLSASDGVGKPIREYGLFSRCSVKAGLPKGQAFFEPAQILESGTLVISKYRTPVPHDGTVGLDMSILLEI